MDQWLASLADNHRLVTSVDLSPTSGNAEDLSQCDLGSCSGRKNPNFDLKTNESYILSLCFSMLNFDQKNQSYYLHITYFLFIYKYIFTYLQITSSHSVGILNFKS